MGNFKLSSGHALHVSGAVGIVAEVKQARAITDAIGRLSQGLVTTYHDNTSKTQGSNLNNLVKWHNATSTQLADYSMHLNAAYKTDKDMGVEVLYVNQNHKKHAEQLAAALSNATGLKNRGAKYRNNLRFLNSTRKPAFLVEAYFVDSSSDVAKMDETHEIEAFAQAFVDEVCDYWGVAKPSINIQKPTKLVRIHTGVYKTKRDAEQARLLADKLVGVSDTYSHVYYDSTVDGYRWYSGTYDNVDNANAVITKLVKNGILKVAYVKEV